MQFIPQKTTLEWIGPVTRSEVLGSCGQVDTTWPFKISPFDIYRGLGIWYMLSMKACPYSSAHLVASFSNPKSCGAWGWPRSWFRYWKRSTYARACTERPAFKWECRDEACPVSHVSWCQTTSRSRGRWEGYYYGCMVEGVNKCDIIGIYVLSRYQKLDKIIRPSFSNRQVSWSRGCTLI